MGWHRGGWYTALVGSTGCSSRRTPRASTDSTLPCSICRSEFRPGRAPESECGFTVVQLTPNRALVLHSTSHLPLSWRERLGAAIEWTWSFVLVPQNAGRGTRFLFRWRGRVAPWWAVTGCWLVVIPADFVMSRDMLRGVKSRASGG